MSNVLYSNFPLAGIASVGATIFTNPLEVVKTRLQLQGELTPQGTYVKSYRHIFHAFVQVAKYDGLFGLQKGLSAALGFQFVLNALRLGTYDTSIALGWNRQESVLLSFFWGGLGGCLGSCLGSPFFLVKTQLQSYSNSQIAVGYQRNHSGMITAFKTIYKARGIRGLYRGVLGNIPRATLGSGAQLATFEPTKQFMRRHDLQFNNSIGNSLLCGLTAGSVMSIAITPPDIIITRLYNQPLNDSGKGKYYSGVIDCFVKVLRSEGLRGLYKGFWPTYLRIAPHSTLVLLFYDQAKEQRDLYYGGERDIIKNRAPEEIIDKL